MNTSISLDLSRQHYAIKKLYCKPFQAFTAPQRTAIVPAMETIKTATFEALLESAVADGEGGFDFTLDGEVYKLRDTLEITAIASKKGYIIIY
jgi:hypothetical protein